MDDEVRALRLGLFEKGMQEAADAVYFIERIGEEANAGGAIANESGDTAQDIAFAVLVEERGLRRLEIPLGVTMALVFR